MSGISHSTIISGITYITNEIVTSYFLNVWHFLMKKITKIYLYVNKS